jgi:hypothetical protein
MSVIFHLLDSGQILTSRSHWALLERYPKWQRVYIYYIEYMSVILTLSVGFWSDSHQGVPLVVIGAPFKVAGGAHILKRVDVGNPYTQ